MIVLCFCLIWGLFSLFYWRKELFGKVSGKEETNGVIDINTLMGKQPAQPQEAQVTGEEETPPYYDEDGMETDAELEEEKRLAHVLTPELGEEEEKRRAMEETVALKDYENLLIELTALRNKADVQEAELQDLRAQLKHYSRYADVEAFSRLERLSREFTPQLEPEEEGFVEYGEEPAGEDDLVDNFLNNN